MSTKLKSISNRLSALPDRLAPGDSWRSDAPTSAARGYGHEWRKARADYLQRHPLCVMCKARGEVEAATVVDHIEPHNGDPVLFWDESNWQELCATDHSSVKQRDEWRRRYGAERVNVPARPDVDTMPERTRQRGRGSKSSGV